MNVFVTVGSWKFDSVIKEIDSAIDDNKFSVDIIMQIGNGDYIPQNCHYFRTAPSLKSYIAQADVVVANGCVTILEALQEGKIVVSYPNKDVKDNHQYKFLMEMDKFNLINICLDVTELPDCINKVLGRKNPKFDMKKLYQNFKLPEVIKKVSNRTTNIDDAKSQKKLEQYKLNCFD